MVLLLCLFCFVLFAVEYSGRVPQFDGLVNENIYLLVTGKISDICEWQLEQFKAPKKHLMAFFFIQAYSSFPN